MSLFVLCQISPKRSDFAVANSAEVRGKKKEENRHILIFDFHCVATNIEG